MQKRIAIIGAGPIGIEAALAASDRGHQVKVFEKGEAGEAVCSWGHTRMFTPFEMNASPRGLARVKAAGRRLPQPEVLLSGKAYAEEYLAPLAGTLPIQTQTRVIAVGREDMLKTEAVGERSSAPFCLLLRRGTEEWAEIADVVFDCSGTYFNPNHLGAGGIPAVGEQDCKESIFYGVPDVIERHRERFAGKRVLVIGAGHSAATVVRDLAALKVRVPATSILWVARKPDAPPCRRIPNDPLKGREALLTHANALACSPAVDFRPAHSLVSLRKRPDGISASFANGPRLCSVVVDVIVAAVGFRPDLEVTRELQLRTCHITEGSYKLAAELLSDPARLTVKTRPVETLMHPEPGFFTLGMKSFGRAPDFLIQTGLRQITTVMDWLDRQ